MSEETALSTAERARFSGLLLLMGAGWGLSMPLSKIALSSGHGAFALVFWESVIVCFVLGVWLWLRGMGLPMSRGAWKTYVIIGLLGSVVPNSLSFHSLAHIPAGVQSIVMSLIPMLAFPIALALGLERFRARRLLGLLLGLAAVSLMIVPQASLPDRAMIPWVFVAFGSAICYGFEGNYVAKWGTGALSPVQVLCGATLFSGIITFGLMMGTGQWVSPMDGIGRPEVALLASSVIHAIVYSGYVWLVGRAGSVFTVQVSYVVTLTGVGWSMMLLNETYSPYIWAALALMIAGMAMVQPRRANSGL